MKDFTVDKIRNIALIGHGGVGKTSLAEALLYSMGETNRIGRVDDGSTISDYHPDEIERKISISKRGTSNSAEVDREYRLRDVQLICKSARHVYLQPVSLPVVECQGMDFFVFVERPVECCCGVYAPRKEDNTLVLLH